MLRSASGPSRPEKTDSPFTREFTAGRGLRNGGVRWAFKLGQAAFTPTRHLCPAFCRRRPRRYRRCRWNNRTPRLGTLLQAQRRLRTRRFGRSQPRYTRIGQPTLTGRSISIAPCTTNLARCHRWSPTGESSGRWRSQGACCTSASQVTLWRRVCSRGDQPSPCYMS
jgi:hypothetical protein